MAEAVLLGLAKSVLGQLSSPGLKEVLLVWNFEKDLKRLSETIETITCFIHDAEQRQGKQRVVKLWLSRLREVLYKADDLFDTIAAKALRKKTINGSTFKKEVTLFFSKSNQLGFVIKIAHDIKAIRERLNDIKEDMSEFKFQFQRVEEKAPHSVLEREDKHSFVDNKQVIGRDRERDEIIGLLFSEDRRQQNLEVISVIGFGGIGKTTLAQFVFNDERVQKGFDTCLWACINYLSDLKTVLVKILKSPGDLHLEQLQKKLREEIEGKKYLLVLDDVWEENVLNWGGLETLLNCGKVGSKVLITTRKTKVARCLDAIKPFYKLGVLSEESAWSLFVRMTFKNGEFNNNPERDCLGKQIVRKCGYVPLLVSLIGRMLCYRNKDKEVWLSFLEEEFAEIVLDDTDDGNVMQVLKVSYNDLPLVLKKCFAYCSVFPKDHVFDKDELVRLWIAQGYVDPHVKESLEKVGDDYVFYMVDTCFFQEVEEYYKPDFGVVRYIFKMHDLLHDLAIQVAKSESISCTDEALGNMVESSDLRLRHISITLLPNSLSWYSNLSSHSKSLRTLRFIEAQHIEINSLKLVLDGFRMLRTLVLFNMKCKTLPDIFGGLIHLRYLDLSENSNLTSLPNSICKLNHLQTLLLTQCCDLVKLPLNFMKLVRLRHLFLSECWKLDSMPLGLESLTTLVSLDRFIVHRDHGGLRYLGRLDELCGVLTLELLKNRWTDCVEDARKANMSSKRKLSGVCIQWKGFECVEEEKLKKEETKAILEELQPHAKLQYLKIENYIGEKLPGWFSSLSNIKELRLKNCSLEYLDISARGGYLLPCLEVLHLHAMPFLRGWWRGTTSPRDNDPTSTVETIPQVSKLVIVGCESLVENMPLFAPVKDLTLGYVSVRLMYMLLSNPQCKDNYKLQKLHLRGIEGLECLPEGLIKPMTALNSLSISDCESLCWVSRRGLACLTSLEYLAIYDCIGVRLEDDDRRMCAEVNIKSSYYGLQRLEYWNVPWQCHFLKEDIHFLTSLERMYITYYEEQQVEIDNRNFECSSSRFEKLIYVELSFEGMACCFPEWIMKFPCLHELTLKECGEMNVDDWVAQQTQSDSITTLHIDSEKEELLWVLDIPWKLLPSLRTLIFYRALSTIPDGIQQLTSLQRLEIRNSTFKLKEIPKWMINLTSLQHLSIDNCSSELKARCEPETGVDWNLISHIPIIKISCK